MSDLQLQEISRQSIVINKSFVTSLCWGDKPLTIHSGKGLTVLEFSRNIASFHKNIDTVESLISCPKTSPATKLFPAVMMRNCISASNYNQMLVEPTFWPHNTEIMQELAEFISYEWSPKEFQYNNAQIMATLTNMGNMEFFGRYRLGWKSILKLSDSIETLYKDKVPETCNQVSNKSLEEIRQCALALETSAMCWGPRRNDSSCYFITVQKNGDLLFWSLNVNENLIGNFITKISIYTIEMKRIFYIPRTSSVFLIVCCDVLGSVHISECEINNNTISVTKSNCLWNHKDKIIVEHLKYVIKNNDVILLFVKHRHLLIQKLCDNINIVSQFFHNVNENKISVFMQIGEDFHVCTENNQIYKINLILSEDSISVKLNEVSFKDNQYSSYSLYGFDVSHCGALYALALVDRRILYRKEFISILLVFLTEDKDGTELKILLDNPHNDLSQMWDCLELVRYRAIKTKSFPRNLDFNQLYINGESHVYYLKLYLLFLMLIKNMIKAMWLNVNVPLPETSVEKVKETIMFHHAQSQLDTLFKSYQVNYNKFDDFEMETFVGVQRFLKYYCLKYKCNLADYVNVDVFDAVKPTNVKQLCEYCNEELVGFSCKDGHMNLFCTLTFTPITQLDYLCCVICDSLARIELKNSKPKCVFCDNVMITF